MKFFILFLLLKPYKVILYPQSALIYDTREVHLSTGINSVELNLSPFVQERSLEVDFPDKKIGIEVLSLDVFRKKFRETVPPAKSLEDSIKLLNTQKKTMEAKRAQIENAKKFLESFRLAYAEKGGKEFLQGTFDPDNLSRAIRVMLEQGSDLEAKRIEIEEKLVELDKEINRLNQKLNEIKPLGYESVRLKMTIESNSPISISLTLKYLITGRTGWTPYYQIKALPDREEIYVKAQAFITQHTGYDWENISLVLSTAQPHLGTQPPEYRPWEIGTAVPRPVRGKIISQLKAAEAEKFEGLPREAPPAPTIKEQFISLQYEIRGKVSISSRKEPTPVYLFSSSLPSDFRYWTYPRVQEKVYLEGKIKNESKNVFLEGDARLYVEDEYIGPGYIPIFVPGDSLVLGFGVDPNVRVEREKTEHKVEKTGIIKKSIVIHLGYRTSIHNGRNREIKIILQSQVPRAHHPDIKIEKIRFSQKFDEEEKEKGLYRWNLKLSSREKFELKSSFDVVHPEGMSIYGIE